MKIGKYAFNSKEQALDKIDALGVAQDEEGNTYKTHRHTIVELGYEVITEATIDEEGGVVTEAVYGTDYLVDVLWRDLEADENGEIDHPYGWKSYSVSIETEGIHSFMGLKYQDLKIS
jgi:hypothetical protein